MNTTERKALEAARDTLATAIKGPHAAHHAHVFMNAAWLRHHNASGAVAEMLEKAARYAA